MMTEWPALEPYDGAFDEVVPHVTVGETATVKPLVEAASVVEASLQDPV